MYWGRGVVCRLGVALSTERVRKGDLKSMGFVGLKDIARWHWSAAPSKENSLALFWFFSKAPILESTEHTPHIKKYPPCNTWQQEVLAFKVPYNSNERRWLFWSGFLVCYSAILNPSQQLPNELALFSTLRGFIRQWLGPHDSCLLVG